MHHLVYSTEGNPTSDIDSYCAYSAFFCVELANQKKLLPTEVPYFSHFQSLPFDSGSSLSSMGSWHGIPGSHLLDIQIGSPATEAIQFLNISWVNYTISNKPPIEDEFFRA